MGKASSSKKVTKAARTGGGRTRKGSSSLLFPGVMVVVVVLGLFLVVLSRNDLAEADATPPKAGTDHWHAALGVYVCGEWLPNVTDQTDPRGIHTHGDGVVHIHPFTDRSGGRNATLGVYFDAIKATVNEESIDFPSSPKKTNGQKCDGKAAKVQTRVWATDASAEDKGKVVLTNPSRIRPDDRDLVTIAFMPEGAEIPRPTSAPQLDQLNDVAPTAPVPSGEGTPVPSGEGTPVPSGEGTPVPSGEGTPADPAAPAPPSRNPAARAGADPAAPAPEPATPSPATPAPSGP